MEIVTDPDMRWATVFSRGIESDIMILGLPRKLEHSSNGFRHSYVVSAQETAIWKRSASTSPTSLG